MSREKFSEILRIIGKDNNMSANLSWIIKETKQNYKIKGMSYFSSKKVTIDLYFVSQNKKTYFVSYKESKNIEKEKNKLYEDSFHEVKKSI